MRTLILAAVAVIVAILVYTFVRDEPELATGQPPAPAGDARTAAEVAEDAATAAGEAARDATTAVKKTVEGAAETAGEALEAGEAAVDRAVEGATDLKNEIQNRVNEATEQEPATPGATEGALEEGSAPATSN